VPPKLITRNIELIVEALSVDELEDMEEI